MAKNNKFVSVVSMLVGILVSLAVGFGMAGGTLVIPTIPSIVSVLAGWLIVASTIAGVFVTIAKKL